MKNEQQGMLAFNTYQPIAVAHGLGVDSMAATIGMKRLGIRPDFILHANVGGRHWGENGCEKIETYNYLAIANNYYRSIGFPEITVVHYEPKDFKNWPPYYSLEENCLTNGTLPSLAFGFKSCSIKWKHAPQNKYCEGQAMIQQAWASGVRVKKVIGYDAGPKDIRRCNHAGDFEDPRYEYWYPLIEWGWDRAKCIEVIQAEGIPVPLKSSCFFCPAMKPEEVSALPPEKLRRIVIMEARAKPRLNTVQGLWRKKTKKRPGDMTSYIRSERLLPAEEIDRLIDSVPKNIVLYQEMYQQFGEAANLPTSSDFIQIQTGSKKI